MKSWCNKSKSSSFATISLYSTTFILNNNTFAITGVGVSIVRLENVPLTDLVRLDRLDVLTASPTCLSVPRAASSQSRALRPIPRTAEGASYGRPE